MAKITLNLGSVLSEILKNSNSNFTELYDAISKIQEKIADDGEKAVVYSTVDKMVEKLNAGTDENGNALDITIGDEIYILDDDTPDFWVSAVSTTSTTGTKPASWEKGTNYIFGKYTIRVSKSREIDLADYQKIVNMQTGDSLSDDSTKTKYPSSHTVYIWVTSLITNINSTLSNKVDKITGKGLSTNDYTNDEKTKVADNTSARHSHSNKALLDTYDQTNANIKDAVTKKHSHSNKTVLDNTTASYTTAEKEKLAAIDDSLKNVTADQIGKVKDVKVNGTSVLGTDGVAAITIADLEADFVSVRMDDNVWATKTVNGTDYQAIKVEKTDTALGVFNSIGQEMVVQKVYDGANGYLYLCVGTVKIACTIRKLSGGAVGTGGGSGSGDVTAAGDNIFTGINTFNEGIVVSKTDSSNKTMKVTYGSNAIAYTSYGETRSNLISFPAKEGTFALTSDIPAANVTLSGSESTLSSLKIGNTTYKVVTLADIPTVTHKYLHNLYITGNDDPAGNFAICAMYVSNSDTAISTFTQLLSALASRQMMATGYCGSSNTTKPVYCLRQSRNNGNFITIHTVTNSGDGAVDINPNTISGGSITDNVIQI